MEKIKARITKEDYKKLMLVKPPLKIKISDVVFPLSPYTIKLDEIEIPLNPITVKVDGLEFNLMFKTSDENNRDVVCLYVGNSHPFAYYRSKSQGLWRFCERQPEGYYEKGSSYS